MFSHFLRKLTPFATALPRLKRRTDAAGWHWQLLPGAEDWLGPDGPNLTAWEAQGLSHRVKENPARSVSRVSLPTGAIYVKQCRTWNLRAWAREALRPAKARLEFENALHLADRAILSVEPLGWACRRPGWPGESVLLTREVSEAVSFQEFLERSLSNRPVQRRAVAVAFGKLLARMHDAGVAHDDPHPGNFLVRLTNAGEPQFLLIDVHAVRLGSPLSWTESRANLVLLNRWFQPRVDRLDRFRFWQAYLAARRTLTIAKPMSALIADVESRTLTSNLRFWAGRESRCLGGNRHFRKLRSGEFRGVAVRDLADEIVQPLLANPDNLFLSENVKILKDSRTSTVAEWHLGSRVLILKRFRIRAPGEWLKNLVRPSAAIRSWVMGHTFADRFLPTPRPLAVLHRIKAGVPREGYLLSEKVPEALTLAAAATNLLAFPSKDRVRIVRLWSERLAKLLRTLHHHGASHRDLKANNILLQGAARDLETAVPVLIDLVGVRTGKPLGEGRRARELARLNASFLRSPLLSYTDRLRFLQRYLLASLGMPGDWKPWWKAIRSATEAKMARNARTGRPLA